MARNRSKIKKGKPAAPPESRGCQDRKSPNDKLSTVWSKSNDPSWYAKNQQLLYDSANVYFTEALGPGFTAFNGSVDGHLLTDGISIPGLYRFGFVPVPGFSSNAASPINTAAFDVFSYVRHRNSGSSNYDAPDLMIYILAMDQVYSLLSDMRRAYKVARSFSPTNSYYTMGVLEMLGYDPHSVLSNLAQFRESINTLSAMAGSMCVPATMPLMDRHIWMSENLYTDSTTKKAQTYMYVQMGYFQYDAKLTSEGGGLRYIQLHGGRTPTSMYNIVYKMLQPIIGDQDFKVMSGDISKAYEGSLRTLNELKPDELLIPLYDEEVLQQMHNTIIVPERRKARLAPESDPFTYSWDLYGTVTVPDIVQDQSNLSSGPYLKWAPIGDSRNWDSSLVSEMLTPITGAELSSNMTRLVNIRQIDATPEIVMVSTRNMCVWDRIPGTNTMHVVCGSELFMHMCVGRWNVKNGNLYQLPILSDAFYPVLPADALPARLDGYEIGELCSVSQFDWHPILYRGQIAVKVTKEAKEAPEAYEIDWDNITMYDTFDIDYFGDLNNFATLSNEKIEVLHRTALMSELDVFAHIG